MNHPSLVFKRTYNTKTINLRWCWIHTFFSSLQGSSEQFYHFGVWSLWFDVTTQLWELRLVCPKFDWLTLNPAIAIGVLLQGVKNRRQNISHFFLFPTAWRSVSFHWTEGRFQMGKKLAFIFKLRREFAFSYGQGHIFPLVDIIHPTTDPEYITI